MHSKFADKPIIERAADIIDFALRLARNPEKTVLGCPVVGHDFSVPHRVVGKIGAVEPFQVTSATIVFAIRGWRGICETYGIIISYSGHISFARKCADESTL